MKVVLFGDPDGLSQLLRHVPSATIAALCGAATRPEQHDGLHELAGVAEVPSFLQPRRRDAGYAEFLAAVSAMEPDLLLVNSYSLLLPAELLGTARRGGVNIHAAPLPRYRGANPIQWMLINDETESGVTIHQMSADFDTGPILARQVFPIKIADTWVDVRDRAIAAIDALLAEALPAILEGSAPAVAQDESHATTCRRRSREDGSFEWTWSVKQIYNLVRALVHPLPGAFVDLDGRELVFDQYLSPTEVAAMKHDAGVQTPLGRPEPRKDALAPFEFEQGRIQPDWTSGRAHVTASSSAAEELLVDYAKRELALTR